MMAKGKYRYNLLSAAVVIILVELMFWGILFAIYQYLIQNVGEFRLERNWVLHLFWSIPILILIYFLLLNWRNKSFRNLADVRLLPYITSAVSPTKSLLKFIFFRLGISFIILSLANPQYGVQQREVRSKGIEVMLAVDVSNSMLAEDLNPGYSRLKIAKLAIEKFIDNLHGDQVGIVVFVGGAYKHLPITSDYKAAKMFINSISTQMMSSQGTDIGAAIETCMSSFNFKNQTNKAIVVFTDGEDHEERGVSAAKSAAKKGVMVNTIGMGTNDGVPIPIYHNGRFVENKKDENGGTVLTKLNQENLIEIANSGKGAYVRANGMSVGLDGIINQINKLEKSTLSTEQYSGYDDQFQPFLLVGLFFLLLELFLSENRSLWLDKWSLNL